jgi:hypothetical protein
MTTATLNITQTPTYVISCSKHVRIKFKAHSQKLRKATICIVMSVHLFALNNLAPNGWLLMKVDI